MWVHFARRDMRERLLIAAAGHSQDALDSISAESENLDVLLVEPVEMIDVGGERVPSWYGSDGAAAAEWETWERLGS